MKFRTFKHNFHDGRLASFNLGPGRELMLEIALDPVWNRASPSFVSVRLGGIENFNEVASYFRALPMPQRPDTYIAEVIGLSYIKEGPNWVLVDLQGHGHIKVRSHHVTES
jgi:hypothetical protein